MKRFVLIVCLILVVLFMAVPVSALSTTTFPGDSISTISPKAAQKGQTITVTITGMNFTTTQGSVWLERSGETDIEAQTPTSWTNGNTIVCKIKIPTSRETGKWNVVVQKGLDSSKIVYTEGFTVTESMTLSSISPTTARADDDDVDFTLTGTNLDDVEEVFLFNSDYDDNITANNVDAESATKVKGTFDLTDAAEDTYDVCVEDSYGGTKCALSFKITTNKVGSIDIASSPSGASIFIDGIANGTTPTTVDDIIVGSHKVILRKTGYEEWGKTVTVTDGDTTEIDAKLYAAATATPATPVPTPIPTAVPKTTRTTVKSTLKVPTTYADIPTTTAASPLDPAIVIGAAGLGIGLVALRRR